MIQKLGILKNFIFHDDWMGIMNKYLVDRRAKKDIVEKYKIFKNETFDSLFSDSYSKASNERKFSFYRYWIFHARNRKVSFISIIALR